MRSNGQISSPKASTRCCVSRMSPIGAILTKSIRAEPFARWRGSSAIRPPSSSFRSGGGRCRPSSRAGSIGFGTMAGAYGVRDYPHKRVWMIAIAGNKAASYQKRGSDTAMQIQLDTGILEDRRTDVLYGLYRGRALPGADHRGRAQNWCSILASRRAGRAPPRRGGRRIHRSQRHGLR